MSRLSKDEGFVHWVRNGERETLCGIAAEDAGRFFGARWKITRVTCPPCLEKIRRDSELSEILRAWTEINGAMGVK